MQEYTIKNYFGFIEYVLIYDNIHQLRNRKYYENGYIQITNIYVKMKYRNQGHGTHLIRKCITHAKELDIKTIKLDDMSDNYKRKNNIYLRNGFRYNKIGEPEMTLIL